MLYTSLHQYFNVQHRHQHFILIMLQISLSRKKAELCKPPQPCPLLAMGALQHPVSYVFRSFESQGCMHALCASLLQEEDFQPGWIRPGSSFSYHGVKRGLEAICGSVCGSWHIA